MYNVIHAMQIDVNRGLACILFMAFTVLNQRCHRRFARYLRINVVSRCFSVSRYDPVSHWCSKHDEAEERERIA